MAEQAKVAIVTGAGHGIGEAVARRMGAAGWPVVVADIDAARAERVAGAIAEAGGRAAPFRADVRVRAEVEAMVARAVESFGRLDVMVANAGIMDRMPFLEMTEAFWHRVLDTNLTSTFLCGQAAARQMIAQGEGGRIINMASNSGFFGGRGRAAYGASKAGIINLTQTMAIELAEHGILVNAVAPGPTRTGEDWPAEPWPSVKARMPLGRWGRPEEIAAVVMCLASDEVSFTTGHTWCADGGFTIAGIMEG